MNNLTLNHSVRFHFYILPCQPLIHLLLMQAALRPMRHCSQFPVYHRHDHLHQNGLLVHHYRQSLSFSNLPNNWIIQSEAKSWHSKLQLKPKFSQCHQTPLAAIRNTRLWFHYKQIKPGLTFYINRVTFSRWITFLILTAICYAYRWRQGQVSSSTASSYLLQDEVFPLFIATSLSVSWFEVFFYGVSPPCSLPSLCMFVCELYLGALVLPLKRHVLNISVFFWWC